MNDPGHPGAPVRDPVIEDRGQQLPLLDYLQLLWFRRKLIIAITLFVAAVGYVKISEIKNVYSASATVLMAVPQVNVVDIQQVLGRTGGTFADVSADVEVMRSRTLAAKVIERLNLLNDAEFNPALGKPETSVFDFLRYADPRTWIPADWKLMLREALGQEAKQAPPPETLPAVDPEQARQQRTLLTAVDIFLGKLQLKQDEFAPVITVTSARGAVRGHRKGQCLADRASGGPQATGRRVRAGRGDLQG
jgi:succinoglycan biosynthesis transport protein ExoP